MAMIMKPGRALPPPDEEIDVNSLGSDAEEVKISPDEMEEAYSNLADFLGSDRFPIEVIPPNIRHQITEIAENKRAHPEMLFMHNLQLASACTGGALTLCPHRQKHHTWKEPCTLWGMIVAESGGAKSPTMDLIFAPLEDMQAEEERIYDEAHKKYLLDLKAHNEKEAHGPDDKIPQEPLKTQYYVEDTTIEAIHAVLLHNRTGVWWKKDELRSLLKNLNKYNKGESLDVLLSLWFGFAWSVNRSSKKDRGPQASDTVRRALCGIYGGIQPGVLEHFFSQDDIFSGLVQRFLFCFLKSDIPQTLRTEPISESTLNEIDKMTRRMVADRANPRTLYLTEEAFEVFADFHQVIANSKPRSFLMKGVNNCLRIAIAMHQLCDPRLIVDPDRIEKWEIEAAIKITKWFLVTMFKNIMPLLHIRKSKSDDLLRADLEKKDFLGKWLAANAEFCAEPRTSTEILAKLPKQHPFRNGAGKPSAQILGTTLSNMGYKQPRNSRHGSRAYVLNVEPGPEKLSGTISPDGKIEFGAADSGAVTDTTDT